MDVLPVIRFLALESNNILYVHDEQRSRAENVLNSLDERFAAMSRPMEPISKSVDRQLAEQTVSYATQEKSVSDETVTEKMTSEKLTQVLRDAGLLVERPDHSGIPSPISKERRKELARKFSVGKPLSEIIIEERER